MRGNISTVTLSVAGHVFVSMGRGAERCKQQRRTDRYTFHAISLLLWRYATNIILTQFDQEGPMRKLLIACLFAGIIVSPAFAGEGHDAGYQWAEDNEIDDTSSCSTASSSFNAGCEEYVEENEGPSLDGNDGDEEEE